MIALLSKNQNFQILVLKVKTLKLKTKTGEHPQNEIILQLFGDVMMKVNFR